MGTLEWLRDSALPELGAGLNYSLAPSQAATPVLQAGISFMPGMVGPYAGFAVDGKAGGSTRLLLSDLCSYQSNLSLESRILTGQLCFGLVL